MKKMYIFSLILIILIYGCAPKEIVEEPQQEIADPIISEETEVSDLQTEAAEDISFLQEDFEEFLEEAEEDHIEVSEDFINQFNSLLDRAVNEFEQDNFVDSRRLIKQAETLLENVDDDVSGEDDDKEHEDEFAYWKSIWNPSIEASFSEKICDTSKKLFEFNLEPYHPGPPPDTYLLKVYVETTSDWTSVEVEGLQSLIVAGFIPHKEVDKNVNVEGLNVYELSRLETTTLSTISAEFDAIVQKEGNTAVFRIEKGDTGTTTYKLFAGNSEIAKFVHNGQGVKTFRLNLDLLSSPLKLPSVRYDGPLFDAHFHLLGSSSQVSDDSGANRLLINPENADDFFATMDKQGVIGLIGFLPTNHENFVPDQVLNDFILKPAEAVVKRSCERIIPFLHPDSLIGIPPKKLSDKLPKLIDQGYREYPIPFRGIGEMHTDFPNDMYANVRLNDPAMFELYDYAAENNLIVMIHPKKSDLEDLDVALGYNPNTILLLHGDEGIERIIPPLMEKHDNLYYSLDAGLMYPYSVPVDGMTKEKFLNNLQSNEMYHRILASALHYWGPLIEAHPDRIMWGTDALSTWHIEVYPELIGFARDFIGGLSPEIQEKYAYKNAERLLQQSYNQ